MGPRLQILQNRSTLCRNGKLGQHGHGHGQKWTWANMGSQSLHRVARKPEQVLNIVRRGHFRDLERNFALEKRFAYCSLDLCDGTQVLKTTIN